MSEGWVECLATAHGAGPTLASFTTAVSCLPSQARHTIGNDDWWEGKPIWFSAQGQISNVVTAQPSFTFEFRLGPTSNIVAFSSGAILTSTTAHTTVPFWLWGEFTVRSLGSGTGGTIMGQMRAQSRAFLDSGATADLVTSGHPDLLAPETTPAVGAGFDTNGGNIADLFVACSVSNAANAITLQQYKLFQVGRG